MLCALVAHLSSTFFFLEKITRKMSLTGDEVDRCVIKAAAEEKCAPECVKQMEAYNGL